VLDMDISASVGTALVYTSENQGHSPEQMAEMALSKMILVAEDANPLIRDQAIEYQKQLREILIYYMKKMAASERTTIWALMRSQGHEDMAEIIRRL
jgi:ribosomal protein L30E